MVFFRTGLFCHLVNSSVCYSVSHSAVSEAQCLFEQHPYLKRLWWQEEYGEMLLFLGQKVAVCDKIEERRRAEV